MEKRAIHFIASDIEATVQTRRAENMVSGISGIQYNINKANRTDGRVQNLAAHIDIEALAEVHKSLSKHKASGVDKVTKDEYSQNLERNLTGLAKRLKEGTYRPRPSRRVYIPKNGNKEMRPLGISCYEDKLVENVIAKILTQIYEPKFCKESFGFRPNRNCQIKTSRLIQSK